MDFKTFITTYPFEVGFSIVFAIIFILLIIVLSKLSKVTLALNEQQEDQSSTLSSLTQGLSSVEKTSLLQSESQKVSLEQISTQQTRASETFVEKMALSQGNLKDSFHQFQTLVQKGFGDFSESLGAKVTQNTQSQQKDLHGFKDQLQQTILGLKTQIEADQKNAQDLMHQQFRRGIKDVREELAQSLKVQADSIAKNMAGLTQSTDERLKEISGQVEKRLTDGFEKTTQTFHDVLKRLALIDDAQKKITELSSNVVGLQEILADKRSRGAFGEVQLESLVTNVMPSNHYKFQHAFSNGKIVDCALFLPEPTGVIGVDSKFPLENYQKMVDVELGDADRLTAKRDFIKDIKKHINDISEKYIIERETSNGAMMFIPAEAVFAEIHAHHPDLVELAHKKRVWLASPTTMMALLTTCSAVLKDEATRKQVHIIQEHLSKLSTEFGRFKTRMTSLSKHINSVTKDVKDITVTADKISGRFEKIENVELKQEELKDDDSPLELPSDK